MRVRPLILLSFLSCLFSVVATAAERECSQWSPVDFSLEAQQEYPWWEFPVVATFTHVESSSQIQINAFYDGPRKYTLRFAAPQAGEWRYETQSEDPSLDAKSGVLHVNGVSKSRIQENPNLRGQVKISDSGRYFTYADGTPILPLGDTNWAFNTARCGLGDDNRGPFYQYLADRKAKGFNTILIAYLHGYGDYKAAAAVRRGEVLSLRHHAP